MDLEVAGANGDVEAVAVAACLVQRPGDRRLADAVEAKRPPFAEARALEDVADRLGLERSRPKPLELPGRAGEHDHGRAPVFSTKPGAVPARPIDIAPSGSVACLRTPCAKSAYGLPSRSANDRETASISASRSSSTTSSTPAARATISTVRSSCVGPEPAGDDAEIGLECFAQRGLEIGGIISDDRDARGIEAEREHGVREKRAVAVAAVAADELAAGGDDRHTRPRDRAAP